MSDLGTIRERIERASAYFRTREAVVLTTFNLNSQFLEDQAMPVILGVEGATAAARNAGLHGQLAETECTVFYDPTVPPGVSGKFRYVARPVPLRGRLFHPKLVIIAGHSEDGTTWVYLAVSSANLTLSGWGRNAESFGETWIHTRRQQACGALDSFLAWLQRHAPLGEEPSERDAVAVVRNALNVMPDVYRYRDDEKPWSGTLYAQFYSSVVDQKGLPSFLRKDRARRPAELWAYSPYWGSVSELVRRFDAHRTALVPAMSVDRKALGLSKSQHQTLLDHTEVWRNKDEKEDDRFWHMKTYWIRFGKRLVRTAVGSCNFTERGLAGDDGNVEAMLVFEEADIEPYWPNVVYVDSPEDLSEQPLDEEEAPMPVPVTIVVAYDWLSGSWRWFLDAGDSQSNFHLSLPVLNAFPIVPGCGERRGDPPSFPARFTVAYTQGGKRKEWKGEVVELHLNHTHRTYGKSLSASDILESWRVRVPTGDIGSRAGGADGDGDGDDAQDDAPAAFDAVNLYDLYRATRALRAKLASLDSEPQKQRALLVGRPDSVMTLARLAAGPGEAPIVRYLVLRELASVVAKCEGNLLDGEHLREVRQMELQAKGATRKQLADELGRDGRRAGEMLDWFEKRLGKMDRIAI